MFDFDLNRDELLVTFLAESETDVAALEEGLLALEQGATDPEIPGELLRRVHTLKGNASCVGLEALGSFAHVYEDVLERVAEHNLALDGELMAALLAGVDTFRRLVEPQAADELTAGDGAVMARLRALAGGATDGPTIACSPEIAMRGQGGGRSLRIATEKLNRMLDLVGEIAIARGQVRQLLLTPGELDRESVFEVERQVDQLQGQLQELVMRARMVPLGPTFRRYARTVRDLAVSHGKQARLVLIGDDVELDSASVEMLCDPLAHLVRNAVDHGVESPAARAAAGKAEVATLVLEARHEGGAILIRLSDDGAGLDRAAIAARGRELGLDVDHVSEIDLLRLIFEPGFTTAQEVSDLSGRGVGLDIVHRAVEALRGTIAVETRRGEGTTFALRLPLTMAVIDGFGVGVGDEAFVLPMDSVLECMALPAQLAPGEATGLLLHRDEVLPLVRLRHLFAVGGEAPSRESVVVLQHGDTRGGLVVDTLHGGSQVVIKPLGSYLRGIAGVSGSSILGNGRVALILDPVAILRDLAVASSSPAIAKEPA